MRMPEPQIWTLPSGLRVVYQRVPATRVLHCGLCADVGSRDELPGEEGMAHFLEHMLFKGTQRRHPGHILSRVDAVGGELNAYTTKEKTLLYTASAGTYLGRSLELLADLAFRSTFPEKEVAKERSVVTEEIDMYDDTPEEAIMDRFDGYLFPDTPLAHPILGTKESVAQIDRAQVAAFHAQHWHPGNLVLSIVGNIPPGRIEQQVEKHFGALAAPSNGATRPQRQQVRSAAPDVHLLQRPIQQAHLIMGGVAPALRSADYLPFLLLNHALGGPPMNARLNLRIRERHGLTYNLYSYYTPLVDGGIWGVYAGLEGGSLARLQRLISKELRLLIAEDWTPKRLAALKKQFVGHLLMSAESKSGRMAGMAKDLLDFGELYPLEAALADIEAIDGPRLNAVAARWFQPDQLTTLIFEPAGE